MSAPTICQSVFVTLASVNLKKQVDFYRAFLAIAPQPNTPTYAEFQLPGIRLAIFRPKENNAAEFIATGSGSSGAQNGDRNSGPSSGAMSLCLEVGNLDDAIAHLAALGCAPPGTVVSASHGQEIYAYDPDGNRLILHQAHKRAF